MSDFDAVAARLKKALSQPLDTTPLLAKASQVAAKATDRRGSTLRAASGPRGVQITGRVRTGQRAEIVKAAKAAATEASADLAAQARDMLAP